MTGASLEFLGWPPLAAMAAAFAAAWLVLRLRRAESLALPRRPRFGLAALRAGAVTVLAVALAEPALAWSDQRREAPAVAIVIDRSGSMGLADPGLDPGPRLAEAMALGLIDRRQRPDAAARAAALARRAAAGAVIPESEATALAGELAGSPELAAALTRLGKAIASGPPARVREAAAFTALAERIQAEADAALVSGAAAGSPLGEALGRIGALPRRDRAAAVAARIAQRLPQALIDWFVLDERLVPVAASGLREALAGESATDLGEALAALARGWAGRGHPAGCILLSDGRRTAGADPEPAARALAARGVRLLAIAIGDPTPPPDVAVAALEAPGEAVAGERVHLTAAVRVPPGAGSWELTWLRDGAEVTRQAAPPDAAWQRLTADFPAGKAGVALWEARLTPTLGEERGLGWLREVWTGLRGDRLAALRADPRWPGRPDERAVVASAQSIDPRPLRGDRLRAWLMPPRDGEYTLWLSSDDQGELLLAEDGDAAGAHAIARVESWSQPEEWDKEPGQRSVPIKLRADRPAYLEAVVVNGTGSSHVAVGWTRPDGKVERPLPLTALVPWTAAGPPARGGARREATVANNAATRAIAIATAPPRVLAIDAGPRWEMRHAVAALETGLNAKVERRYRTVLGPGIALVPEQAALDQVDMLLLGDLPPAELGADEQARIAAFVTRRGGFVALVSGPRAMPAAYGLGPLAALLPVRSAAAETLPEPDAGAGPGPAAERILPGLAPAWEALPALPWWIHSAVPRPGAEIVLSTRDRSGSPLLVCAEHGAGRVAWLGSDELWRWRAQGDGSVHAALWLRLARWGLGARLSGADRRLQAALDVAVTAPGQPAGLRLRALDETGAPAPAPPAVLVRIGADGRPISGSSRELALVAVSDQPGTWSTTVNQAQRPLEQGRWRLSAGATPGPLESRELLVRADPGREALEPALDRSALDRLAAATGGEAVGLDGVDAAIDALAASLEPRAVAVRHRLTLWDGPWWLLALAALLVGEWAWRRRLGLP
jgi:hypothetical protein